MKSDATLQDLLAELEVLALMLQRPVIQMQLAVFVAVLVMAWLLSAGAWRFFLRRWLTIGRRRSRGRLRYFMRYVMLVVKFLLFPVLGLILMNLAIIIFQERGLLATILSELLSLFWYLIGYRLVVMLLHTYLPRKQAGLYHYWLALPVFVLCLGYWLKSMVVLLQLLLLNQIELVPLFNATLTLGDVFWVIVSFYLLFFITLAIQDILQSVMVRRSKRVPEGIRAILSIGRYTILAVGALIILAGMGIDLTVLAVIGGGLSVGIGFGLQSIISNFISGIVLLFERSLQPGDMVEVEGITGIVKKLDVRATTVRRFDNIMMIIPNETLFTSTVTNYTQNDKVTRVMMGIGVSYNSDPIQVMDILRRVCREHPLVMDDPEPLIFFKEYGDSSLNFGLGVWLADTDYRLSVPSELLTIILAEFKQAGIEIPFPQRDLHIRSGLPWPKLEMGD